MSDETYPSRTFPPAIRGVRDPLVNRELIDLEADIVGPWLVTIDLPHHQIHEGESWSFTEVITLGSAAVQDYLITIPAGVYPHFGYAIEASFGITVELFEGTNKTQSASALVMQNRNRSKQLTVTPLATIHKGTNAGTTDGTRILHKKSGTGTTQGKAAGQSADARERILNAATSYLFRITSAAASNDVSVEFDWYEEGAYAR